MSPGAPGPSPWLVERVARLAGMQPVGWTRVERGYTAAGRWLVRFAGGRSAFAKVGITPQTAGWLRAEERVYSQIAGDFLPRVLGWDGDDEPILLLEDLSRAGWPPP